MKDCCNNGTLMSGKTTIYYRSLVCIFVLLLDFCSMSVHAEVTQVDNETLKELREQGVALIDVRREDEWRHTGMIEGSHALTFFDKAGRYNVQKWLSELEKIAPNDAPFVLICAVGGRTKSISNLLDKKLGYTQVHNLTRGIREWITKGEKTVAYQPL